MRITLGRGNRRQQIEIPTGKNVGVTQQHVNDMCTLMTRSGVRIVGFKPA